MHAIKKVGYFKLFFQCFNQKQLTVTSLFANFEKLLLIIPALVQSTTIPITIDTHYAAVKSDKRTVEFVCMSIWSP